MRIEGSIALVTGANRGIGRAFVDELVRRGAAKVYAGVRNRSAAAALVAEHGDVIVPLELDVTDPAAIAAAAEAASDTTLLVNNAGMVANFGRTAVDNLEGIRQEMEVNVFGPLALASALRPSLERGRGAIINVNSIASFFSFPPVATYSASKAAAHSLTMALRVLLGPRGVAVLGVYPGPIDTDLAEDIDLEKASPQSVAEAVFDGLERGEEDVYPDAAARTWHEAWRADAKALEREMASMAS